MYPYVCILPSLTETPDKLKGNEGKAAMAVVQAVHQAKVSVGRGRLGVTAAVMVSLPNS